MLFLGLIDILFNPLVHYRAKDVILYKRIYYRIEETICF